MPKHAGVLLKTIILSFSVETLVHSYPRTSDSIHLKYHSGLSEPHKKFLWALCTNYSKYLTPATAEALVSLTPRILQLQWWIHHLLLWFFKVSLNIRNIFFTVLLIKEWLRLYWLRLAIGQSGHQQLQWWPSTDLPLQNDHWHCNNEMVRKMTFFSH